LNSIDVFVSASLYEGCSNAILEAMAAGLPVVATKVGGNTEIVNDGVTGILVPAQNPDALAVAVTSLLNNSELMKSMGKKGRERIEADFLLSKMVKNTEELYETLIKQK
jgi:glycosyltransferase involved in cell wall biosynthesis